MKMSTRPYFALVATMKTRGCGLFLRNVHLKKGPVSVLWRVWRPKGASERSELGYADVVLCGEHDRPHYNSRDTKADPSGPQNCAVFAIIPKISTILAITRSVLIQSRQILETTQCILSFLSPPASLVIKP